MLLGYNTSPLLVQQFCCRPDSFRGDLLLRDVYRCMYDTFGINYFDVSWLTRVDPMELYQKLVYFGQKISVECRVNTPRFMVKKLLLQIAIHNHILRIRLLNEWVLERINVREDPCRPGYKLCRWPKPMDSQTHVINTDGSWSYKEDRAAIGWIFRTAQGCPLQAYSAVCQKMPVYVIEVWSVREALRCAGTTDMKVVVVEADANIAISLINTVAASFTDLVSTCKYNGRNYLENSTRQDIRGKNPREDDKLEDYVKSVIVKHAKWTLGVDKDSLDFLVKALVDVIYYLQKFEGWACRHLFREANREADFLTKLAKEKESLISKFENFPQLLKIIEKDACDDVWFQRKKPTPLKNNFDESSGWRFL